MFSPNKNRLFLTAWKPRCYNEIQGLGIKGSAWLVVLTGCDFFLKEALGEGVPGWWNGFPWEMVFLGKCFLVFLVDTTPWILRFSWVVVDPNWLASTVVLVFFSAPDESWNPRSSLSPLGHQDWRNFKHPNTPTKKIRCPFALLIRGEAYKSWSSKTCQIWAKWWKHLIVLWVFFLGNETYENLSYF